MTNHTPKLAIDLDNDIEVLSAMASNLTPYLYEDELFGFLSGTLPQLTVGGLLLRLYRLSRINDDLTAEQNEIVQNARLNFEAERSQWISHYLEKIQREMTARVRALEQFLAECGDDRAGCSAGYPVQAEKRTMIEHLTSEAADHDVLDTDLVARLHSVDMRLRGMLREGAFIMDERFEPAYPPERFWWLHGYIPAR